jgi:acetylornithine deacetylase/succinyl-diaminopimelate desuccinylase-like protein
MTYWRFLILVLLLVGFFAGEPAMADLKEEIEFYIQSHQKEIIRELVEALSIPDVAADRDNIRRKAEYLRRMFERRGFTAELLETDGNPLVYGELVVPGADRTLLLYCHYDGQPVDPSQWKQDDPFRPILRDGKLEEGGKELNFGTVEEFEPDWRIYGRSASDDTSPIVAIVAALDALRFQRRQPKSNLRIILDGEEEVGSPSLTPAIDRYNQKLHADMMLILDGPVHPSRRPTLVYGARGILTLELTTYGPKMSLHSGHYGNWAPNPAMRLAQLLASMKNEDGRTIIAGFNEGVQIPPEEMKVLDSVPDDLEALEKHLGFAEPDRVGRSLQEAIQYPSLNVRGLKSAWVGSEVRTIVPDRAIAAIDVRLVKETPADDMYEKVVAHIKKQGYHVVQEDPDDAVRAQYPRIVKVLRSAGSEAYRTSLGDPRARELVATLTKTWGETPVRIRTSGGTVPIAPFVRKLGFPAVSVPIVNFDNNQHSPNENLQLGYFFNGIVTLAAVFTM